MDYHLAGEGGAGNGRNGYGKKTVITDTSQTRTGDAAGPEGELRPAAHRQVPAAISGLRRQDRVDIRPRYPHGPGEIQGHLADLYGLDVSPDLISAVTDAILDEIAEWQDRPLEAVYLFGVLRRPAREAPR